MLYRDLAWNSTSVLGHVQDLGLKCVLQAQLLVADASAPAPWGASDKPCCQDRATFVPIATYIVDIGLPLVLLLISYVVIRCVFHFSGSATAVTSALSQSCQRVRGSHFVPEMGTSHHNYWGASICPVLGQHLARSEYSLSSTAETLYHLQEVLQVCACNLVKFCMKVL